MTLRRQLLLVSLLLLALPWAGCQFIREMEGALRQGQADAMAATAAALGSALRDRPELLYPDPSRARELPGEDGGIYAWPAEATVIVDGYAEGWDTDQARRLADATGFSVSYQAVTRGDRLYLLFQVRDERIEYHNPGLSREPNGDRLHLATWRDGRRQDYVIASSAPGQVRGRYASRILPGTDPNRIKGVWQDTTEGYTLELEMPLAMIGERLGFYVINVGAGNGALATLGNIDALRTQAPPWLIHHPPALAAWLAPQDMEGRRIMVVDKGGWLIGSTGQHTATGPSPDTFWLLRTLYRWILGAEDLQPLPTQSNRGLLASPLVDSALQGYPAQDWYRDAQSAERAVLSASASILDRGSPMGVLVVRQDSDQYLSLTDAAFGRLLGYSFAAMGLAALALLGYATVLGWRIRRLSKAAAAVTREDGSIAAGFPRSAARDEIGDLSRRFADLLARIREYNEYLSSLSRKLNHELRTPIAVIQSSLDNLAEPGTSQQERDTYLARARVGLGRLARILTAMGEASGLEQSIRESTLDALNLAPLLEELTGAYEQAYPGHRFALDCPVQAPVRGNPDLLVQALDKLVDNACSHAPEASCIIISMTRQHDAWRLSVANSGSRLPEQMTSQLFEPMVSLRGEQASDSVHLGLGLHIVRLIAQHHSGRVAAENLADGTGVRFSLYLPLA